MSLQNRTKSFITALCVVFAFVFTVACESDGETDYEGDESGECDDGADNDRDGDFDCDDEGCASSPVCTETDGDADGDADGDSDGDADGDSDGDADGDSDGDADGDSDGDADGDSDGDADGDSDGDSDADAEVIVEECNGLDDDGDGEVDEDFECIQSEETTCTTTCGSTGTGLCSDTCELPLVDDCTPPDETCGNGIDDDCDGVVDPSVGTIVDPMVILDESENLNSPSIAWNGTDYGVAWQVSDGYDGYIYFARYDSDGIAVIPPVLISDFVEYAKLPSLVWDGVGYGITWIADGLGDDDGVRFARLAESGMVIGTVLRLGSSSIDLSELVWNGTSYGVAFIDKGPDVDNVMFARISSFGVVMGEIVNITELVDFSPLYSIRVIWDGFQYVVSWISTISEEWQGFLRVVGDDGVVSGDVVAVTAVPSGIFDWAIATNGSGLGIVWSEVSAVTGHRGVYFSNIDEHGTFFRSPLALTNYDAESALPSIVWDGEAYLIFWEEHTGWYEGRFALSRIIGTELDAPDPMYIYPHNGSVDNLQADIWGTGQYTFVYQASLRVGGDNIEFASIGGCW